MVTRTESRCSVCGWILENAEHAKRHIPKCEPGAHVLELEVDEPEEQASDG